MNTPDLPLLTQPPQDSDIEHWGLDLLRALLSAIRAQRLYPEGNTITRESLEGVIHTSRLVVVSEGDLRLQLSDDAFFLNETRLRATLGNWSILASVRQAMESHRIGTIGANRETTDKDWAKAVALIAGTPSEQTPDEIVRITEGRIRAEPPISGADHARDADARGEARRAYAYAVHAARDVMQSMRMGQGVGVRRMKRAVQTLVDSVLNNETSMVGMTSLRDYDEYTFTHSVNVCIFSLVLGKRLGLPNHMLYELGVGALLHDVGKMAMPIEVTTKETSLTDEEWAMIKEHPTEGFLHLAETYAENDLPLRALLIAYEHHMRIDLSGYPSSERARKMMLFSRIVAVADSFDAGTTKRSYQPNPARPDEVLQEMRDNPKRGLDPLLVKAFVSVTGIYPVGSVVILDNYEIGIVKRPGPKHALHRPVVVVVFDDMGLPLDPAPEINLSETDGTGMPKRSIIKTTDAARYGLRVADYLA